ncbi:MAG: amidohydrolase family protein [Candidatus Limnocylindrales bacterium]
MSSELAAQAIREAGVCDGLDPVVNKVLTTIRLVDHHVHGAVRERTDDATLIGMLLGSDRPSTAAAAGFDTQVWLAIRRWCGPLLRAPAHVAPEDYLVARRAYERLIPIAQVLLPRAGLDRLIVDDGVGGVGGVGGSRLTSPAETGALAGARASRVVSLEALAERLVCSLSDPAAWPDAFRAALSAELAGNGPAVGFQTVLAHREGFDHDLARPGDEVVSDAAVRWAADVRATGPGASPRLADETLLRFGIWSALDTGRPLQVHTGLAGSGLDPLSFADPLVLAGFLRAAGERAPIVLLHPYPYQRSAGYLARTFPHVYLDLGPVVTDAGAASEAIVRESLELAPFSKVLFSSDAGFVPELHLLGSWLFRRAMSRVLGDWVARGDWSRDDAERGARLVGADNARRVYRVPAG